MVGRATLQQAAATAASAAQRTRACCHLSCAAASFSFGACACKLSNAGSITAARTTRIEHEGQVADERRGQTQHAMPRASTLVRRLYPAPSLQFAVGVVEPAHAWPFRAPVSVEAVRDALDGILNG